jgi:hypothetical protein
MRFFFLLVIYQTSTCSASTEYRKLSTQHFLRLHRKKSGEDTAESISCVRLRLRHLFFFFSMIKKIICLFIIAGEPGNCTCCHLAAGKEGKLASFFSPRAFQQIFCRIQQAFFHDEMSSPPLALYKGVRRMYLSVEKKREK